jgi:hypothetical protein
VCGTVTDDGERMVSCDKCGNWLHTRCIGLADGKDIPPDFSLSKHLRIKCCKHIKPASLDDMPKIYYCTARTTCSLVLRVSTHPTNDTGIARAVQGAWDRRVKILEGSPNAASATPAHHLGAPTPVAEGALEIEQRARRAIELQSL